MVNHIILFSYVVLVFPFNCFSYLLVHFHHQINWYQSFTFVASFDLGLICASTCGLLLYDLYLLLASTMVARVSDAKFKVKKIWRNLTRQTTFNLWRIKVQDLLVQ